MNFVEIKETAIEAAVENEKENGRNGRNKRIGEHFHGVKTNYRKGGKKSI